MKYFASLLLGCLPSLLAAQTHHYKCYSYYSNGYNEKYTMTLSVNSKSAKADITGEQWDFLGGKIDPNYKSKGNIPYVKYGHSLIVEKILLSGGKELKDGSMGGFARVEGEAEGGFYQYKFVCKR